MSEISIGTPLQIELDAENGNIITGYLKKAIYTNPKKASVIEILSNGYDATKKSKREAQKPIVSLFSDKIVIRDFGDGMSPEFISTRYRKMTNSTSRDEKDNIGTLGIGSKSPLGYTKEFYLNTISGGKRYSWVIADGGTQSDTITLIAVQDSKEYGTEVIIPIKSTDFNEFKSICEKELMYFDINAIGFNKKERSGVIVYENENGIIRGSYGTKFIIDRGITILLGPVMYNYTFTENTPLHIKELYLNSNMILKFNTYELEFSLGRETLQSTDKNDKIICEKIMLFLNEYWKQFIAKHDIKIRSVLELPFAAEKYLNNVLIKNCEYYYNNIGFEELMSMIKYCRYYYEGYFLTSSISIEDIKSCKKIGYTYKISEDLIANMKSMYKKDFMIIKLSKLDKQSYVDIIKSSFDCLDDLFVIAKKTYKSNKNLISNFNYRLADINSLMFNNPARMTITDDTESDIIYIVQKYDCVLSDKMKVFICMTKLMDTFKNSFKNIAVEQSIGKELISLGNNFITEDNFFTSSESNSKKIFEVYSMLRLLKGLKLHELRPLDVECLLDVYADTPLQYFISECNLLIPRLFYNPDYSSIDELKNIDWVVNTEQSEELKMFLEKRDFLEIINPTNLKQTLKKCESLIL